AWFMGAFFFLAGLFVESSYAKKGFLQFLFQRAIRLLIPFCFFYFVLGPLTTWTVLTIFGWEDITYQPSAGPLWFARTLFIFSLIYACVRYTLKDNRMFAESVDAPPPRSVISVSWTLCVTLFVGSVSAAMRGVISIATMYCYYPQYVTAFVLGMAATRYGWLHSLERKHLYAGLIGFGVSLTVILTSCSVVGWDADFGPFWGMSYTWPVMLWAFDEQLMGFSVMLIVLYLFSRPLVNRPSASMKWIARRAFGVYICHTICISIPGEAFVFTHAPYWMRGLFLMLFGVPTSWAMAHVMLCIPWVGSHVL
ncbi:hypothetical protein KIPB_011279, partial [Kipferlia bialata]